MNGFDPNTKSGLSENYEEYLRSKMKHTPTPWSIARGSDESTSDIQGLNAHFICEYVDTPDAEHIVKCVNEYDKLKASHQELLEAAIAVISIADRKTKEFDRLKEATSNAKELG